MVATHQKELHSDVSRVSCAHALQVVRLLNGRTQQLLLGCNHSCISHVFTHVLPCFHAAGGEHIEQHDVAAAA